MPSFVKRDTNTSRPSRTEEKKLDIDAIAEVSPFATDSYEKSKYSDFLFRLFSFSFSSVIINKF